MRFTDHLRNAAAPIWAAEHRHPFVTGIGDGTLHVEKFRHYMMQDYVFLIDFSRVIALAVAKAEVLEDMAWLARLLHETLNTEMALHVGFCADFGITEADLRATKPFPTNLAYTRHMLACAYSGDAGETATAILPCSWGYSVIGQTLAARGLPRHPLYRRWIEMYASPEFAALADWLREFVDRRADAGGDHYRARLEGIFLTSSRYEYMFWDAAYRLEGWSVWENSEL
ncbi:MAG: thiaminase II [SAR202 cluster bacterium]|nr:thiaminase II [SAR202 cluster bacterium]